MSKPALILCSLVVLVAVQVVPAYPQTSIPSSEQAGIYDPQSNGSDNPSADPVPAAKGCFLCSLWGWLKSHFPTGGDIPPQLVGVVGQTNAFPEPGGKTGFGPTRGDVDPANFHYWLRNTGSSQYSSSKFKSDYNKWYRSRYGTAPQGECPTATCHTLDGTFPPLPYQLTEPFPLLFGLVVGSVGTVEVSLQGELKFSQITASPSFDEDAPAPFKGETIGSVANKLREGTLTPSQVPVKVITIDDTTLIVNTRSSLALRRAGIPQSEWTIVDMTESSATRAEIMERLSRNGLTTSGTPTIRITGAPGGQNASSLK